MSVRHGRVGSGEVRGRGVDPDRGGDERRQGGGLSDAGLEPGRLAHARFGGRLAAGRLGPGDRGALRCGVSRRYVSRRLPAAGVRPIGFVPRSILPTAVAEIRLPRIGLAIVLGPVVGTIVGLTMVRPCVLLAIGRSRAPPRSVVAIAVAALVVALVMAFAGVVGPITAAVIRGPIAIVGLPLAIIGLLPGLIGRLGRRIEHRLHPLRRRGEAIGQGIDVVVVALVGIHLLCLTGVSHLGLLGGGDQPEVMFSMLKITLGCYRIPR